MNQEPTLTEEQRKRLDRQRFIGVETQKRLLAFRIFITPANGINTELAKNLILAGVNVSIYDDAILTQQDFESNFLVAKDDLGKKRGQTVFERLRAMNPTGKNEWIDEDPSSNPQKFNQDFFKNFTIMVTSEKSFNIIQRWDEISKKANIPYYNQLGCGLYAFAYISLGMKYEYKEVNKKDKQVSKIWEISSLTLDQALKKQNLTRAKESVFLSAVMMMEQAESQGLTYDPFLETNDQEVRNKNDENLGKIASIGASLKESYEKNMEFYRKFVSTYGIDYCPVYSVVGSVISQEIIKIAENQHEPGINWLFYESEEGYASVFKVKSQQEFIKSRVPEEVKMTELN